ncbi:MAG TPA: VOC family protein [Terriglobales bacterium]|jgi:catechol 2,3-dioxygenase-like lactoylglutathione lyase family enzyme|nr:VOC family protein [Terriglobales bacterium]
MSQTASSFKQQKYDAGVAGVDMKLEVALIPVSDVDLAKKFYTKLGWRLDDDIVMGNDFRVVQFTPPGSGSSISFGKGVTEAAPGSFRGGLIVSDIEAAHKEFVARGINASEVFHGSPFSPAGRISGPDPERQSYSSYIAFEDLDGNAWIVQEVTRRLPGRIDSATTTFATANDLASAMRRAEAAHGEHEKRNGQRDANWPGWYAEYMAAEQAGTDLPK